MLQNLCIQKTYTQKIPNKGLRCQRARCSVGHTWAPTHRRFHLAWVGELCMCERSRWNGSRFFGIANGPWLRNLRLPEHRGGGGILRLHRLELTALRMTSVECGTGRITTCFQ